MFENPRRGSQSRLNTKIRSTMLCLSCCELYSRRVTLKTKTLFSFLVKLYNPKKHIWNKDISRESVALYCLKYNLACNLKKKPGPKLNSWVFKRIRFSGFPFEKVLSFGVKILNSASKRSGLVNKEEIAMTHKLQVVWLMVEMEERSRTDVTHLYKCLHSTVTQSSILDKHFFLDFL